MTNNRLTLTLEPPPFLQTIREQKGMSQRSLSRAAGISRSQIQRLELKPWLELSLQELAILSRGLSMKLEELIRLGQEHGRGEIEIERASLKEPFSHDRLAKGAGLASLIKNPKNCFVGSLILEPKQGIPKEQAPSGEFLFCYVLQGMLLVSCSSKEHLFKEEDCFSLERNDAPCDFFNPHQMHKSVVLLMSVYPPGGGKR